MTSDDFPSNTPSLAATNLNNLDNSSKFLDESESVTLSLSSLSLSFLSLVSLVSLVSFCSTSCLDSLDSEFVSFILFEFDIPLNMKRKIISLAYLELNVSSNALLCDASNSVPLGCRSVPYISEGRRMSFKGNVICSEGSTRSEMVM